MASEPLWAHNLRLRTGASGMGLKYYLKAGVYLAYLVKLNFT